VVELRKFGFTLVEILVAVIILALLVGISLPILASARKRANEAPCESNLHQLAAAVELYTQSDDGILPPSLVALNLETKLSLKCPSDILGGANAKATTLMQEPVSYFYLPNSPGFRDDLSAADANYGIAYCVLHCQPLSDTGVSDPVLDTTGEVLRVRIDGSVEHAQVRHLCSPAGAGGFASGRPSWTLLTGAKCPPKWCVNLTETCF